MNPNLPAHVVAARARMAKAMMLFIVLVSEGSRDGLL